MGELAQARPGCFARDGAESDADPQALVVRDDGNPVDPLPDLALVDLDEAATSTPGSISSRAWSFPTGPAPDTTAGRPWSMCRRR
jgi:hypothetical protein